MQDGLTKNWKKTLRRVDTFGDYTVSGFQYESEDGETGWHITAWGIHRPVHDYWVSGKDFYTMRIHYFHNFSNRHLIELFGTITDLEEAEQKAVLKAIKQWEDSMLSDSQVEKLSEVLEQHRQQHESVYLLLIDRKTFGLTPELQFTEMLVDKDVAQNRRTIEELAAADLEPLMFVAIDRSAQPPWSYGALGKFVDKPELEELLSDTATKTYNKHLLS